MAALLACNLAAFKVAAPAAGCRGAPATVTKACCAMRPGGCCCKAPASNDGTPAWCAPGCATRVAAGLIHPQWEPVLLAEAAVPGTATPAAIDTGTGPLSPRGADPPPVPPPQVA